MPRRHGFPYVLFIRRHRSSNGGRIMSMMKTILGLGAGVAAIAASGPASAQYWQRYGYTPVNSNMAASQCSAAVQNRLYNRTSLGAILGSLVGVPMNSGRVVSITQVNPRGNGTVRVRGLATS